MRKSFWKHLGVLLLVLMFLMQCAVPVLADGEVRRYTVFVADSGARKAALDSPVQQQMREEFGVEFEWIIPAADPRERLGIMLAADTKDLPDLIVFGNSTNEPIMRQYIAAGKLLSMNDYLETYAPEVVENNFKNLYNRLKDKNGQVYFLPSYYNASPSEYIFPENTTAIWMKTAFFDETDSWDLIPMDTYEDVTNVLRKVKEHYPNQVPMSLALGANGRLNELTYFGASSNGLVEADGIVLAEDGSLSYIMENEEMKEFYRWVNSLNQEGLLDIESPLLSVETLREKIVNDQAFCSIVWGYSTLWRPYNTYQQSLGNDDKIMFFNFPRANPSVEKKTFARSAVNVYSTGLAVTANMENPEEFFEFYAKANSEMGHFTVLGVTDWDYEGENTIEDTEGINLILSKEPLPYGTPGKRSVLWTAWTRHKWDNDTDFGWQFGVENMVEFTYKGESAPPNAQYDVRATLNHAWGGMNTELSKQDIVNERVGWGRGLEYYKAHEKQWVDTADIYALPLGDDDYVIKAAIQVVLERMLPRIVMAATDEGFEQEWSNMMTELETAGLTQYMESVRAAYAERQARWNP